MSVFSILRRGRQAAKEHNAKVAEQQKQEDAKAPYRHVPTHAAVDALAGAPSSWKEEDRPRIMEQNRRRSEMVAAGTGRGMPGLVTPVHAGLPRVNSTLSHVSYPSAYASPVVHMPRNYSYHSVYLPRNDGVYSVAEGGSVSSKGKEVERPYNWGRSSRASSSKGWKTRSASAPSSLPC